MAQDNAATVRSFTEEVISQGDIDSAARFVWEDVVEQFLFLARVPDWKA